MMQDDAMPPWVEGRRRAGIAAMRGVKPVRLTGPESSPEQRELEARMRGVEAKKSTVVGDYFADNGEPESARCVEGEFHAYKSIQGRLAFVCTRCGHGRVLRTPERPQFSGLARFAAGFPDDYPGRERCRMRFEREEVAGSLPPDGPRLPHSPRDPLLPARCGCRPNDAHPGLAEGGFLQESERFFGFDFVPHSVRHGGAEAGSSAIYPLKRYAEGHLHVEMGFRDR